MDHAEPANAIRPEVDIKQKSSPLTQERIAELAKKYRETEDQRYFEELAKSLIPRLKAIIRKKGKRKKTLEMELVDEILLRIHRIITKGVKDGRFPLEDEQVNRIGYIIQIAKRAVYKDIKNPKKYDLVEDPTEEEEIQLERIRRSKSGKPKSFVDLIEEAYEDVFKKLRIKFIDEEIKKIIDIIKKAVLNLRRYYLRSYKEIGRMVYIKLSLKEATIKAKDTYNNEMKRIREIVNQNIIKIAEERALV